MGMVPLTQDRTSGDCLRKCFCFGVSEGSGATKNLLMCWFMGMKLGMVGVSRAIKIPQSLVLCGFQRFGAPEGTRTPASGSGGLRDIRFTTGATPIILSQISLVRKLPEEWGSTLKL